MAITIEQVEAASRPEDLFGSLSRSTDKDQLKKIYRRFSQRIHPDQHSGEQRYSDAFARLNELYIFALKAVDAPDVTIRTKQRTMVISGAPVSSDGVADTYSCEMISGGPDQSGVIKIARDSSFNDLMENEFAVLGKLRNKSEGAGYFAALPLPLETFVIEGRRGTAYATIPGAYTLSQVHDAYPNGVDAKTMVWMWRQLLDVLGYAHSRGIIHGAVLPHHISIYAEEHRLVLTGWHAAVDHENDPDAHVPVIDGSYRDWYPPEVLAKQTPAAATDIYLAAATMAHLLGGNHHIDPHGWWPASVPPAIRGFLISCLLPKPGYRPQDAWALRAEFTELIEAMWGPRKFHPFHMPNPGH